MTRKVNNDLFLMRWASSFTLSALRRYFLLFCSLSLALGLAGWAVLDSPAQESGPSSSRADLEARASESIVEITTIGRKSGKPRTIPIWFIYEHDRFYIQAGNDGKTSWYRNLKKNSQIGLKIEDLTFTAKAQFIDDPTETERIHEMFRSKYLRARLASWFGSQVGHGRVVEIELPF